MSERKSINKYYPPDYDPSLASKSKKKKKGGPLTIKIRMMAPYLMRCLKCNEYIAQRRSFNARKEVTSEVYLKTKIIRFHITCPVCNNHISFKTDPKLAGYIPEEGAVRNFEPSKKIQDEPKTETEDEILLRLEKEELENKAFQLAKEQRKRNPFWKKQEPLNGESKDVFAALQERLVEQQRQQEVSDHLEGLHEKVTRIEAHGGAEKVALQAQQILAVKRPQQVDDDEEAAQAFKRKKDESNSRVEETRTIPTRKIVLKKEVTANGVVGSQLTAKGASAMALALGDYSSSLEDQESA